ncbi:hypothetical protein [Geobacter sp.]|uniref:hypothetical protein n=1 Tax=Geobacter sp. TaxID=46610 RepID=UPI0027B9FDBD|nr:hypothetical protein [Geobacter sp.]
MTMKTPPVTAVQRRIVEEHRRESLLKALSGQGFRIMGIRTRREKYTRYLAVNYPNATK